VLQQTRFGRTKHPALQIVRDQAQIVRAFAQEFGLTPSARSGIELPKGEPFDDARGLLS
jgi:phage terminase small subunit